MKTIRLHFRKFTSSDFDFDFQLVGNYRVMKMITGSIIPIEKAKEKYKDILRINARNPGPGYFLVSNSSSGEFIGLGKLVLTTSDEAEIGYIVLPGCRGMGYGGEISKALVEYAKKKMNQ